MTPEQWFWATVGLSVVVYCGFAIWLNSKEDPLGGLNFEEKKISNVETLKMVVPPVPRVSRACGDNTPHVCKCGSAPNKPTPLAMKLGKEVKDEDSEPT